jgi:hypothetical protein
MAEGDKKANVLQPNPTVLIKLGSIAVHMDEMLSEKGHAFDVETIRALLNDEEVKDWLAEMDKLALLPRKR